MRLWICTDHDTHWPVGGASIVWASDEDQAQELLKRALAESGLDPESSCTLAEVRLEQPGALVLCDGNY